MPRKKVEIEIINYGIYTPWERGSKELPRIRRITAEVPTEIGVEFGMIIEVKRAKGEMLDFIIDHPPFPDKEGEVTPPFEGSYFISSNDFKFFLGDTVWEPIEDKKGRWTLTIFFKGKEVARKCITLI